MAGHFPSSKTHQGKYDVFLSFRGQDTRKNLTSHLVAALGKAKIQNFYDDDELDKGEAIKPSLLKAIEESKVSVIIFSENYANSRWCLDELVKIMECKKNTGQITIPVFYQVSASHVRHQTKSYEKAFDKLKQRYDDDQIQKWRDALKEAADLSGWSSKSSRDESKLIEQLVGDILKKLNRMSPIECSNLVGIDSRIEKVQSILRMNDSQSVGILGIWGMGGSGKTAIAGAVFNQISMQFEGSHFLLNASEELKRHNEVYLRNKVISSILEEENLNLNTPNLEQAFMKDRFRRKKVLLVLDDVEDSVPLESLLREPNDLFGQGSRIIITSRDQRVLKNLAGDIYEMQRLDIDEALELFSFSAFKVKDPPSDYKQMSTRVINYTKCNPFALKVLGSALSRVGKEEWPSKLEKLGSDPRIQNMTRRSYDGLNSDQKGIFLDIAYFFEGEDREYVIKVLEGSYSSVHYDIDVLIDKTLVTMSNNKIEMHNLMHEMGLNIVREAESGGRSRLRTYEEICDALIEKKGNEEVEGIILDISQTKELKLEYDAFKGTNHLRLLKFYVPSSSMGCSSEVNLPGGKLSLPGKLSYLHWYRYPLKSLPNNFCAENLAELNLPYSKFEELALGKQDLPNLKWVDLRRSEYLYKISGLSRAINLESLVLQGCTRLTYLDQSIQYLRKIKHLDLAGCEKLTSFPKNLGSEYLKFLDLSYCFNIRDCPEISGQMEELDLSWTAIEHVHPSIQQLKCLRVLRLNGCSNVTNFPVIPESIEELYLSHTAIKELPSSIKFLTLLAKLDIGNCWKLSNLADNIYPLKYLKEMHSSGTAKIKKFAADRKQNIKSIPSNLYNFASLHFHEVSKTKEELATRVPGVFGVSRTKASLTKDHTGLSSKVPDDLGCLLSLKHLILKRMDFESLPSSIKHLSQLQLINLSKCKRLKSLPELPPSLEILDADNCTSLESLFSSINFKYLNLENCRQLDQKTHRDIMENAQSIIQCMARKSREEAYPVQFLFPGSEMPPLSYNHTNVGSSVTMQWPSDWSKFNGIVFCMLFGPEQCSTRLKKIKEAASPTILSFGCKCCIKANKGREWELNFGQLNLAKSDHVLTWYDPCRETFEEGSDDEIEWFKKYSGRTVSFEFHVETLLCFSSQCTVKKCGILLLQNDTQLRLE